MKKTKKLVHIALLCGVAVALSLLEGLFAPILPPGVKPGLSNIITMLAATWYGVPAAMAVVAFKAIFALVTRGGISFAMSLVGGICSALCTALLLRAVKRPFGTVGISVLGALLHNLGQFAVSLVIMGSAVVAYLPILISCGAVAGGVTGVILHVTVHQIASKTSNGEKK